MSILSAINPLSWIGSAMDLAKGALGFANKLVDADVQKTATKAVLAGKLAAAETENNKLRSQQWGLMFGWPPFRWLMLYMLFTAVWHTTGVYFDSCAHLPILGWWGGTWYPYFMPHEVGSWNYSKLPGNYADQSFKIIAMITGIQITQSLATAAMAWLTGRK